MGRTVDMVTLFYFHQVPNQNRDQFLEIQRKAAAINERHGATGDWPCGPNNLDPRYNCSSFSAELTIQPGEELFFSMSLK
ncbi:MAG: DUF1428 family protein [Bdellovibrionales bacterium]|jgi:hypothetical protein|nr:DUF1428 family protein [Bdellovibrionales bacterium]